MAQAGQREPDRQSNVPLIFGLEEFLGQEETWEERLEYAKQLLLPGERLDDLQRSHFVIIQDPKRFCFGMDAVLLSGFASVRKEEKMLDMCSGNGIVAILMAAKSECQEICALEIQKDLAQMAYRSVRINGIEDRVRPRPGDIRKAAELYGKSVFDVVTCNPPYMNSGGGLTNPASTKAIARHEICCTFEDVAANAAQVLKPGGRLYLVHRPHRLTELFETLKKYRLEPKRMKLVHPFADQEANMVLIEAIRGGKPYLKVEAPIIVYREPGVYTDEIREIYGY